MECSQKTTGSYPHLGNRVFILSILYTLWTAVCRHPSVCLCCFHFLPESSGSQYSIYYFLTAVPQHGGGDLHISYIWVIFFNRDFQQFRETISGLRLKPSQLVDWAAADGLRGLLSCIVLKGHLGSMVLENNVLFQRNSAPAQEARYIQKEGLTLSPQEVAPRTL